MDTSKYLSTVYNLHIRAKERNLFFLHADSLSTDQRLIRLSDKELVSFSSCSYLGLEFHPEIIEGITSAAQKYGSQFSSSRGYVSAPLYSELEERLSVLFGGYALVTSSTSMGHQVALPVLATENDAIVFDHQVHHSVQQAITLCRAGGAEVVMVKHRELSSAFDILSKLSKKKETVWFACDGVYSMYGDMLPTDFLRSILDIAPNIRLYVDDAHGMSWSGIHGRGRFLTGMQLSERIVFTTSLNKAFAAAGGVLVFSTLEERERVRLCGAPLVFSGPIQPPMLGAALSSALIHLSPEIYELQATFKHKVQLMNSAITERNLPLLAENESPIFFLQIGEPEHAFEVVERVKRDGYYVNLSMYPSVPIMRSGIRLSVTNLHSNAEIVGVTDSLAKHLPDVLEERSITYSYVQGLFSNALPTNLISNKKSLRVEHFPSIESIPEKLWDHLLGKAGACSWQSLLMQEKLFTHREEVEHNWKFHYFLVRDAKNKVIAATFFVEMLQKDDIFLREEVSFALELERKSNPYLFCSRMFIMGGVLSEGNHIFINKREDWRGALECLFDAVHKIFDESSSTALIVRDIPSSESDLCEFLGALGYVKEPHMDSFERVVDWENHQSFIEGISRKSARKFMKKMLPEASKFVVKVYGYGSSELLSEPALEKMYAQYKGLSERKFKLNVFKLPSDILPSILSNPSWELLVLFDKESYNSGKMEPLSWAASHLHDRTYSAFFCGFEERKGELFSPYRHMLLEVMMRAKDVGAQLVRLGMSAEVEKVRLGAVAVSNVAFVRSKDHYQAEQLREFIVNLELM